MIIEELDALVDYLQAKGLKSSSGGGELTSEDYPHVIVVPTGAVAIETRQPTMNRVMLTFEIKIISSEDNEMEVWATLEKLIQVINLFRPGKGGELEPGGNGTVEYGDGTYQITIPYRFRHII